MGPTNVKLILLSRGTSSVNIAKKERNKEIGSLRSITSQRCANGTKTWSREIAVWFMICALPLLQ
jgi:hypothetical protein